MTDMEEIATLLVRRRRLLLEITGLVERWEDGGPQSQLSSLEERRVLASVQRFCRTREQVFWVDRGLLPHLRREVERLDQDADLLRRTLTVPPPAGERGLPGIR